MWSLLLLIWAAITPTEGPSDPNQECLFPTLSYIMCLAFWWYLQPVSTPSLLLVWSLFPACNFAEILTGCFVSALLFHIFLNYHLLEVITLFSWLFETWKELVGFADKLCSGGLQGILVHSKYFLCPKAWMEMFCSYWSPSLFFKFSSRLSWYWLQLAWWSEIQRSQSQKTLLA